MGKITVWQITEIKEYVDSTEKEISKLIAERDSALSLVACQESEVNRLHESLIESRTNMRKSLEVIAVTKGNMERVERDLYLKIDLKDAEIEALGIENDRRGADIEHMNELLRRIGDMAHDASTGPAIPDILWEIRDLAYHGAL
jgi:hypothetical protein